MHGESRLHPWSWLFVLIQQLKQFVLPLLAILVFGGRNADRELWGALAPVIAMIVLVVIAVMRYFTYRYRIGADGLTVRSGWLHRSVRDIPYARIHNVVVHQSLLHRLFGVAEVRLESAGGEKPEAEMRVLSLAAAAQLENLIRHRGAIAGTEAAMAAESPSDRLLELSTMEIIRLGLISNRGLVIVAAAFGAAWQIVPERRMANWVEHYAREAFGFASHLQWSWLGAAAVVLCALLAAIVFTRVLSIIQSLLQYHGFTLSEADRRLTVERGLLARVRSSVARRRIQAWTLREGVLHRLFRRRSLRIDTAVAQKGNDERALKVLAPIATPAQCDALIAHLLPVAAWPPPAWNGWPPRILWRIWWPSLLIAVVLAIGLFANRGSIAVLILLWPLVSLYAAYRQAVRSGYSVDDRLVAVRGGAWSRWWRFAEIDKLQAMRISRTPMDRWCGTATLWLDTAGDNGLGPPLRLRFLALDDAIALQQRLSQALAHRRLRW